MAPTAKWAVGYYHEGIVDIVSVPPTALGEDVRATLARVLNLTPSSTKVLVLTKNEAGKWPTPHEAPNASGKELGLLLPVQDQLQNLPGVDAVQLRVAFYMEDQYEDFSRQLAKSMNVAVSEIQGKRKAATESVVYSSGNREFMKQIGTTGLKATKYDQEMLQIPKKYMEHIRNQYTDLVTAVNEPWLHNDATRGMYITSILTTYVAAAKDKDAAKRSSTLTQSTQSKTQQ